MISRDFAHLFDAAFFDVFNPLLKLHDDVMRNSSSADVLFKPGAQRNRRDHSLIVHLSGVLVERLKNTLGTRRAGRKRREENFS